MKAGLLKKWTHVIVVLMVMLTTFMSMSTTSYAEYNRGAVSTYASKHVDTYSSKFYDFSGSDCTNFASQCVFVGGISMTGSSTELDAPSLLSKTLMDTSSSHWYMKKIERSVGYDYWQYSKTWSVVSNFKTYHKNHSGATVTSYKVTTQTGANNVIKTLKNGDVVQYISGSKHHSIVITAYTKASDGTSTNVKYCAHDSDRKNESIDTFFDSVLDNGYQNVYVIHFE